MQRQYSIRIGPRPPVIFQNAHQAANYLRILLQGTPTDWPPPGDPNPTQYRPLESFQIVIGVAPSPAAPGERGDIQTPETPEPPTE